MRICPWSGKIQCPLHSTMNQITIELLTEDDIEQASLLMREVISNTPYYNDAAKNFFRTRLFTAGWIRDQLKQVSGDWRVIYLAAKDGDRIAAVATGWGVPADGVFVWEWLLTSPDYRRQGVGERLGRELETMVKGLGFHKAACDTRTNNTESVPLLEKLGYHRAGELKDHWFHQDFYFWDKLI